MFNFHNRQFVFRQNNGEIRNIYCDARQNLFCSVLSPRGIWNNTAILHKNATPFFYAEIDQDDIYHVLFQDNNGSIFYSRLEGQSVKTMQVLSSKTPNSYNKQLYIAPFRNNLHFFYVLQHNNSFLLAYQVLANSKMSTPKVVDYVSGSDLPCSIIYDREQNITVFYQSYDGKYLQLGYKKFISAQKHWSDFTPVTKYTGNCEYPHAIIDQSGIIHLCYQRRAPKLYELVYQQKTPDRNLWSAETILHSSIHSFENASILQVQDRITVYWVREDVIYFSVGAMNGSGWGKPSKYNNQFGRQLQCLCYKSNSPRDRLGSPDWQGDGSSLFSKPDTGRDSGLDTIFSFSEQQGDSSPLSPRIYPGTLSNGFKLAFINVDNIRDGSPLLSESSDSGTSSGKDVKSLVVDTFIQLQGSVDETREGLSEIKMELSKLTNAYIDLTKEMSKYSIRLNMMESQLVHLKKSRGRPDLPGRETAGDENRISQKSDMPGGAAVSAEASSVSKPPSEQNTLHDIQLETPPVKKVLSLDPDKLKEWEEWKEPKEWQEDGS